MGKTGAVIVAAGRGARMNSAVSKQYLKLRGKPVLAYALEALHRVPDIAEMVVVAGADELPAAEEIVRTYGFGRVSRIVPGGRERQDSVYRGLLALPEDTEWVIVHDGVRPFVTAEKIVQCLERAKETGAAVLAVPVKDTIKQVDSGGKIANTPDRRSLWAVQTPQAFRLPVLKQAHEQAAKASYRATDDAMLLERMGVAVHVVEGDYSNIKITTPDDFAWAEYYLQHLRGRGDSN
jgi:2-C-methyl-D-erythritol 4-phosphate cytidylyltransferase